MDKCILCGSFENLRSHRYFTYRRNEDDSKELVEDSVHSHCKECDDGIMHFENFGDWPVKSNAKTKKVPKKSKAKNHPDAKEDKVLVKKMVKKDCLK